MQSGPSQRPLQTTQPWCPLPSLAGLQTQAEARRPASGPRGPVHSLPSTCGRAHPCPAASPLRLGAVSEAMLPAELTVLPTQHFASRLATSTLCFAAARLLRFARRKGCVELLRVSEHLLVLVVRPGRLLKARRANATSPKTGGD